MTCTSAEAAKLLRKLNEEYDTILMKENLGKEFLAAVGEDLESVRPAYDFPRVQQELASLEERIRKVRHAINVFNCTHKVPGFDMTIDEMLVYIPQLNRQKTRLGQMQSVLPKTRENAYGAKNSGIIDYRYANYNVDEAAAAFVCASEELSRAQTALDVINNTETFEMDL